MGIALFLWAILGAFAALKTASAQALSVAEFKAASKNVRSVYTIKGYCLARVYPCNCQAGHICKPCRPNLFWISDAPIVVHDETDLAITNGLTPPKNCADCQFIHSNMQGGNKGYEKRATLDAKVAQLTQSRACEIRVEWITGDHAYLMRLLLTRSTP
jgi:hypothetical protein